MVNVKDKPPNEIFLDLLQDNEGDYIDYMGKILTHEIRPRLMSDSVPSLHSILDNADPEQRGIPHGKHVLDRVQFQIVYYTWDLSLLWSAYQSIKEIIVGNNKVQNTTQFTDSGIKWSMLRGANFDFIFVDQEELLGTFSLIVEAVYDESYT